MIHTDFRCCQRSIAELHQKVPCATLGLGRRELTNYNARPRGAQLCIGAATCEHALLCGPWLLQQLTQHCSAGPHVTLHDNVRII